MKLTTEQLTDQQTERQMDRLRDYVAIVKENMAVQLSLLRRAENAERQLEQERMDRTAEILRAVEREERYVAQITQLEMDKEYLTKRMAGMKQEWRAAWIYDGLPENTVPMNSREEVEQYLASILSSQIARRQISNDSIQARHTTEWKDATK